MKNFISGTTQIHNKGKNTQYSYFLPELINRCYQFDTPKLLTTLEQATKVVGELNSYSELIPDIDFFIKMHIFSESVASSKIEGTQTDIQGALLPKDEIKPDEKNDWIEVHNYIKAMNQSIDNLSNLPVSTRLLKQAHLQLLSGTRGQEKMPGELRNSQNWIGGASINSAYFIPPHHQHLPKLLSDWEQFWHNNHDTPILIKVALCHYQFETIHPFLDGNGRIGRLFIILQLIESNYLSRPILYLSSFFAENRKSYYQALDKVRDDNNINQWLLFFLEGIISTAQQSKETLKNIITLKADYESRIIDLGKKATNAKKALNSLYSNPIVSVKKLQKHLNLQYNSANNLIKNLVDLGVLAEITGQSRNRFFVMVEYMELFDKKN